MRSVEIKFRLWIEKDGEHVIGKGGAKILRAIKEEGSISAASRKLEMSYKYVWDYVRKMEKVVGKVVESTKGGKSGGKSVLTEKGEELLRMYEFYEHLLSSIASGRFVRGKVVKGKIVTDSPIEEGKNVLILIEEDG